MKNSKFIMTNLFKIDIEDIPKETFHTSYDAWDGLKHTQVLLSIEEKLGRSLVTEEIVGKVNLKKYS